MIEIKEGSVYINGQLTNNNELIGFFILDLAEDLEKSKLEIKINQNQNESNIKLDKNKVEISCC